MGRRFCSPSATFGARALEQKHLIPKSNPPFRWWSSSRLILCFPAPRRDFCFPLSGASAVPNGDSSMLTSTTETVPKKCMMGNESCSDCFGLEKWYRYRSLQSDRCCIKMLISLLGFRRVDRLDSILCSCHLANHFPCLANVGGLF